MCDNAHLYFAGICCFIKLQKRSHSAVPLDVWVPSKLDREAISGCLQLPFSFIEISMTVLQKCKKSLQYYLVYGAQAAGN